MLFVLLIMDIIIAHAGLIIRYKWYIENSFHGVEF